MKAKNTRASPCAVASARRIETQLGERVNVAVPDWAHLMKQGVVVKLHLRRWRGRTQITLNDLGIPTPKDVEEQRVYDELMTLGAKRLLPAELLRELNTIDSGARKVLSSKAYQTYWGEFIPIGAWDEWKRLNGEYRDRYLAVRDRINIDWSSIMRELFQAYDGAAHSAYKRLLKLNRASLGGISEDTFVASFIDRIRQAIPSREEVVASFAYETEINYIPLPSLLAADEAETQRVQAKRDRERRAESIEQDALANRERDLARLNAEVVSEARSKKDKMIADFVFALQEQSISLIYDGMVNVLESMQRNDGDLIGRSTLQVRNTVAAWKSMNLIGNADIDAQIARIENMLDGTTTRNVTGIQTLLREIGTTARSYLVAYGATPRSARNVGIADDVQPIAARIRQRRAAIPLEGFTVDERTQDS